MSSYRANNTEDSISGLQQIATDNYRQEALAKVSNQCWLSLADLRGSQPQGCNVLCAEYPCTTHTYDQTFQQVGGFGPQLSLIDNTFDLRQDHGFNATSFDASLPCRGSDVADPSANAGFEHIDSLFMDGGNPLEMNLTGLEFDPTIGTDPLGIDFTGVALDSTIGINPLEMDLTGVDFDSTIGTNPQWMDFANAGFEQLGWPPADFRSLGEELAVTGFESNIGTFQTDREPPRTMVPLVLQPNALASHLLPPQALAPLPAASKPINTPDKERVRCSHCSKTFARAADCRRHEWSHGPPKYRCSVCDKTFTRRDKLNDHVKVHRSNKKSKVSQVDLE